MNRAALRSILPALAALTGMSFLADNALAQFAPAPGSPFAAGNTPVAMVTADFNGDGLVDLAEANQDSNSVVVLLGNAAGGFTPAPGSPLGVGVSPVSLAVGDFNGDGKLDLAVVGFPPPGTYPPADGFAASLTIWLGMGNGSFVPSSATPAEVFAAFLPYFSISPGDFDGDGKLDIAVTTDIWTAVLVGDGAGGFTPVVLTDAPQYPAAVVQAGNFNGPGLADFALVTDSGVSVWSSNGNGGYTQGPSFPPGGGGPFFAAAGDFNGDGFLDLVVYPQYGASFSVLLGNGHGGFSSAITGSTGSPITALSVADFNRDGYADIAVAFTNSNTATVLLGGPGPGSSLTPISGGPFTTGSQPMAIVAGDFNGDHKPDIVTANFGTHDVTLLLNTLPSLTANPAALQLYAGYGQPAPAAIDVAVTSQPGPAATFSVTSNQPWLAVTPSTGAAGATSSIAVSANPAGLAAGSYTGTLTLTAPGYFGSQSSVALSLPAISGALVLAPGSPFATSPNSYTAVASGDFNNDGNPDIVSLWQGTANAIVLLGDGKGGFTLDTKGPFPAGTAPYAVSVGDFNQDGNLDIAVANYTVPGTVTVLLGDGHGGFTVSPGSPFEVGDYPLSIAAADFNRDGKLDLLVGTGEPSSGSLSLLLGNGAGSFSLAPNGPFPGGAGPVSLAVADFNGDGNPDVATADDQGAVTVLLGNGAGGFTAAPGSPFASNATSLAAADLNADGKVDLVVATATYGPPSSAAILLFLGDGAGGFTPGATIPMPPGSLTSNLSVIALADFNGDGQPDIAALITPPGYQPYLWLFLGSQNGSVWQATGTGFAGNGNGAVADFNHDGRPDLAFAGNSGVDVALGSLAPTSVIFFPNANPVQPGQSVQLTADLTVGGYAYPGGTVSFLDGATLLATVGPGGYVDMYTATLSPGVHNLSAAYNGDAFTLPSTSIPDQVVVCDFTFNPAAIYLDDTAQASTLSVTANSPGCNWAPSAAGFVTIAYGGATGNGAVGFTVSANAIGADRTGMIAVGVQTVSLTQRGSAEVFTDVTPSSYYFDFVNLMDADGITGGCQTSPPEYCPNDTVTRGEMAVFLVTTVMGGNTFTYTTTPYFTDVPSTNPFFKFIQKLKDLGITNGCSATTFCPNSPVTRDETAAFVIRARYETTPYTYPSAPYFTDVPPTDPFFPFVQKMAQDGITGGCAPGLYCPGDTLTRGQMSVFVVTGLLNQLQPPGTAYIAGASPNSAAAGQSVTVTLTGVNTNFAQGATQVTAAPGITVSNVTVTSPTALTVQLSVAPGAVAGPTSIVVTTGNQEADLPNGLTIQ